MSKHSTTPRTLSRRLAALLAALALLAAMALPVYAEVDLLPDAHDEVELLEDEQGTASGEDTVPPEQNAATPEPEQSAGPEQNAPTETPEPTAEPTPTPEPAVTATATPVPTVTPTATPEPTEQPQKMYAAKSVDNVQAVSERGGVPDTYTLYFAVPDGWTDCKKVKIHAIVGQNETSDRKYYLDMQEADKTDAGRKIYSAVLNKDKHYPNKGLGGLEFCGYTEDSPTDNNPKYKVTIVPVDNHNNRPDTEWISFDPNDSRYIKGNYYDGNKGGGLKRDDWITYTVSHKHFAGKTMAFKNKTSETLTDVQAWFYEPDDNGDLSKVCGPIPLNSAELASGIASGSTATFKIPDDYCSYVKFTWNEGNSPKSSKIYNFYGKDVSGNDEESFTYSDISNCFIYTGADNTGAVNGRWGIENSFCIYYDATFSKLLTTGKNDTDGDYSIPKAGQSTVYYRIRKQGETGKNGTMSRIKGTDYYVADVPDGYTEIVFSSYPLSDDNNLTNCGNSTGWENIPSDYRDTEQCFYADTNDDAVYHKGPRGGYWAPKGTKRDAEEWKNRDAEAGKKTPIVDIASADFTEEPNTKYVTSTLYDYYTDYELNGKNRDNYGSYTNASHRTWVTFREFDQALSDYYEKAGAQYPIYTGHFQPAGSPEFREIASTLKLFGYSNDDNVKFNRFMAINNAQRNEDNTSGNEHTYYAYQGLVADKTSTGNADGAPLLNGTTSAVEPHFNKEFLLGENSKNAKLGEVYENVKFPFTKRVGLFDDDTGVDYWYFDSKDTTLYLKQDSGQNSDSKYFLQSTENRGPSKNVSALSGSQDNYGYFPFNETASSGVFSTYNYGFGTKLQMDFTLTDDGMVETKKKDNNGNPISTNIKFFFSGDDDVWVFIDGQLALDVGGAHGEVSGLLEFGKADEKNNSVTAYVSRVKKGGTSGNDKDGKNGNKPVKTVTYNGETISFYAESTPLVAENTPLVLAKGQKHTLTMYYMERGMWESNMAVAFNFPDYNELQVKKEVDVNGVNDLFKNCFTDKRLFNFTIRNQATHYGTTDAKGDTVTTINLLEPTKSTSDKKDFTTTVPSTTDTGDENRFKIVNSPPADLKVTEGTTLLNWFAELEDLTPSPGSNKNKRYGILRLDGDQTIDISGMSYLSFDVYVDSKAGDAALSNMYLELRDSKGKQKGCLGQTFIGGKDLYGQVEMHNRQWITVKLSLDNVKADDNFDKKNVKELRFGCNYPRSIYLRNIVFSSKAVPQTVTGFTTKQQDIADYGSAQEGKLMPAVNAQYTSDAEKGTMVVDKNGGFVLKTGETISFKDQFRRGSYLSINEQVDKNLFDTQWTIYEDGKAVNETKEGTGSKLKLEGKPISLKDQTGTAPDDRRIENKDAEGDGTQNAYGGQKPSTQNPKDNTIVFRSYTNPDATDAEGETQLKVVFVNTVKTGSLTIKKEQDGKGESLTGKTYMFRVRFTNVGGHALEDEAIVETYPVTVDKPFTIDNIPVGTRFTIEEVTPEDGSKLTNASVTGGGSGTTVLSNNTVRGSIVAGDENKAVATFTNTKQETLDITGEKVWKNADNSLMTEHPATIYVQLQRRCVGGASESPWTPVTYLNETYTKVEQKYEGMKFSFLGLPAKDYSIGDKPDFEYRVVEGSVDNEGVFHAVKDKETITIGEKVYGVTYDYTNPEPDATNTNNAKQTMTITNTQQDPKFTLDITKADAEDTTHKLAGVEFTLEKLTTDGNGNTVVDSPFGKRTGVTNGQGELMLTDSSGNATTTKGFKELEAGTYRLTETKAAMDYNLLSEPIIISFSKDGKCKVGDDDPMPANEKEIFTGDAAEGYTLKLTVLNRKTPALPHTGADAPSLWLLIGLPLAVAGLLILVFRYNKKGGRTR